ncbi:MAG: AAA family ATPase [Bacillota bacterium]|nr:AAA family ATPase [Bacillota bacterium]
MERTRVLIATRDPSRFEKMIPTIVATGRFTVVGIASNAETALDECKRLNPHVLIAGTDFQSPDVWHLVRKAQALHNVAVVLVGGSQDTAFLRRAMQSGAKDFLFEPLKAEEVIASLDQVRDSGGLANGAEPLEAKPQGKIITIFGTKGGVGKSFIAANVASSAQIQSKKRCVIVDLDLEFGCLAALFGLRPRASIVDLCRTEGQIEPETVEKVLMQAQPSLDLRVLVSPPTPDLAAEVEGEGRRVKGRSYVTDILSCLKQSYDYIFVDTASSFRETNIAALDMSDVILVVTAPDIPTLQNTGKCLDILLEAFKYPQEKVLVALNRADGGAGLTTEDIARGLQYSIKYELPSDGRNVTWSANCGRPLIVERPKTPVAEAVNAMASGLIWQVTNERAKDKPARSHRRRGVLDWLTSRK